MDPGGRKELSLCVQCFCDLSEPDWPAVWQRGTHNSSQLCQSGTEATYLWKNIKVCAGFSAFYCLWVLLSCGAPRCCWDLLCVFCPLQLLWREALRAVPDCFCFSEVAGPGWFLQNLLKHWKVFVLKARSVFLTCHPKGFCHRHKKLFRVVSVIIIRV